MVISTFWKGPKTYSEFQEQYPTLLRKLFYWASKRHVEFRDAQAEVICYIHELVLSRSNNLEEAVPFLKVWSSVLSLRERQELSKVTPYRFSFKFLDGIDKKLNWYNTSYSVLKEVVLKELFYKNQLQGILTINSYEAVILNADRMLIVDVDITGDYLEYNTAPFSEKQAITALTSWQAEKGGNFRVYRTAGGLRYIETSREWTPSSRETKVLLSNLYADTKYSLLCQTQETFRARLTPKPWRYDNYDLYLDNEEAAEDAGVCQLIDVIGDFSVDSSFKDLITVHDKKTKALSNNLILV